MSRNDSQINKQDQSQPGTHGHTTEFFVDGEPQSRPSTLSPWRKSWIWSASIQRLIT